MLMKFQMFGREDGKSVLIELMGPDLKLGLMKKKWMVFNCHFEKLVAGCDAYANGKLVQDAFPFLSAAEREFLMSGLLPEEFDEMFNEDKQG